MMARNLSEHNSRRLRMNKFNYDKNGQLKTRLAILESQLTVANREADSLKVKNEHLNKLLKRYSTFSGS